jgi:serine/threonine-protein kinase
VNCPSCSSPLEPNARFCGVCGYRLQANRPPAAAQPAGPPKVSTPSPGALGQVQKTPQPKQGPRPIPKKHPKGDEVYIGQTLNNRFKIESKIGEGGFGAVYRGIQLATGRKVALKLLHPEMTKDENLVARFRREGMVLCNLRDAHTITTYDFDQTPDGTLYIAMELLEGKSLHQVFHEQAPLEWKRMFKILAEMCSSLAEAHAQGIVHRDLKPENVYLESRPGNPEFVKILDFGIAKVMRGDSIDPASPQLTATGQTLGTLEYMSPEQLMGKPLDGRSDVYALGVVAYEMITGRLPFPDAKGPAGLITAQLKQTPQPPSQANQKVTIPQAADRVILKALEKNKDNRYPDVSAMSAALQEVLDQMREASNPLMQPLPSAGASSSSGRMMPQEMLETRRGDPPQMSAPPQMPYSQGGAVGAPLNVPGSGSVPYPPQESRVRLKTPGEMPRMPPNTPAATYPPPNFASQSSSGGPSPLAHMQPYAMAQPQSSTKWIWWVVGLLVLGAAAGAVLAYVMK